MVMSIENRVIELFRMISAVPRPSYHEEKIADFICDFAKQNGLLPYRDAVNNVLVNVPATKGYEDHAAVVLQGHTDMVCEKNEGVEHDFMSEGIKIIEENGWLTADGTTLGADNGVAVAIMLYVIEGGIKAHPPVQCLFTVSEEVGLDGAKAFDYGKLYARRLLNMDAENMEKVIVGCAGGLRSNVTFEPDYGEYNGKALEIRISGLYGGHSGENIASGRANANILMGRLLGEIAEKTEFSLVSLRGGSKDNAIPREAVALIAPENIDAVIEIARVFEKEMAVELSYDDRGFKLDTRTVDAPLRVMDKKTTKAVISLICSVKNGIIEMSKKLSGLVEYSRNLGVITTDEKKLTLVFSSRSAIDRQLDAAIREIDMLASLCGASAEHYNRYPGWAYAGESDMADAYIAVCKSLYGTDVEKEIIHAGLECGIIKSYVPDMDCISCGPNMRDLHSPDEAVEIESFGKYARAVEALLGAL